MGEHEPVLYRAGRHGSWGFCVCRGWRSRTWTTVIGVHLDFGSHLLAVNRADAREDEW